MVVDRAVAPLVRTHPAVRLHIKVDNWANLLLLVMKRELVVLPLVAPWFHSEFGVVRLAHRSLSPIGEIFARILREEDAKVFGNEKKAIPKTFAAPRRARAKSRSATGAAPLRP